MYDPVYGNHIGVVIDNQDPENRGRLQIFIPHLSNNLLPTWNTNLQDISFKSTEVDAKLGSVLERLKNTLPWAETAVPSFGGGTAGPTKYDGNSSPLPLVPNAAGMLINAKKVGSLNFSKKGSESGQSFDRTNLPANLDEVPDNVLRYIAGIGAGETGVFTNMNYDYILKQAYDPTLTRLNAQKAFPKNATEEQIRYLTDEGFFQFRQENVDEYPTANVTNKGSLSEQTVSMARYLKKLSNDGYKLIEANEFDSADKYFKSGGVNGRWAVLRSVDNGYNKAITARSQDAQKIRDYINAFDKDPDNLKKQNELIAGNSISNDKKSTPIQMTDSLAAEGGVGSPSGGGAAAGFFSKPAVGAKVWVFFHGGDVQRPVYFASVMEPANYQVANQTVASSG